MHLVPGQGVLSRRRHGQRDWVVLCSLLVAERAVAAIASAYYNDDPHSGATFPAYFLLFTAQCFNESIRTMFQRKKFHIQKSTNDDVVVVTPGEVITTEEGYLM